MKKAIIWDLDGTILDTLDDLSNSVNYVLRAKGFSALDNQKIKMMLG